MTEGKQGKESQGIAALDEEQEDVDDADDVSTEAGSDSRFLGCTHSACVAAAAAHFRSRLSRSPPLAGELRRHP